MDLPASAFSRSFSTETVDLFLESLADSVDLKICLFMKLSNSKRSDPDGTFKNFFTKHVLSTGTP
jgi:hypothetical protein